jgi:hypothetical protein
VYIIDINAIFSTGSNDYTRKLLEDGAVFAAVHMIKDEAAISSSKWV